MLGNRGRPGKGVAWFGMGTPPGGRATHRMRPPAGVFSRFLSADERVRREKNSTVSEQFSERAKKWRGSASRFRRATESLRGGVEGDEARARGGRRRGRCGPRGDGLARGATVSVGGRAGARSPTAEKKHADRRPRSPDPALAVYEGARASVTLKPEFAKGAARGGRARARDVGADARWAEPALGVRATQARGAPGADDPRAGAGRGAVRVRGGAHAQHPRAPGQRRAHQPRQRHGERDHSRARGAVLGARGRAEQRQGEVSFDRIHPRATRVSAVARSVPPPRERPRRRRTCAGVRCRSRPSTTR